MVFIQKRLYIRQTKDKGERIHMIMQYGNFAYFFYPILVIAFTVGMYFLLRKRSERSIVYTQQGSINPATTSSIHATSIT